MEDTTALLAHQQSRAARLGISATEYARWTSIFGDDVLYAEIGPAILAYVERGMTPEFVEAYFSHYVLRRSMSASRYREAIGVRQEFHAKGVPDTYSIPLLAAGVRVGDIQRRWTDAMPVEYVTALAS